MKRRKGFTLVELLVVIAIIALLVSILMPALGRARELAKRVKCGHQVKGHGAALVMYQNDFKDQNPKPFSHDSTSTSWLFGGTGSATRYNDSRGDGTNPWSSTNLPTLNAWAMYGWNGFEILPNAGCCLYRLVKYEDVAPKAFICPSAPNDEEMDFEIAIAIHLKNEEWKDLNDFMGGWNLSYSFKDPWEYPTSSSTNANVALIADKSNRYDTPDFSIRGYTTNIPNYVPGTNAFWTDQADTPGVDESHGNSNNHQTECQNILFASMDVKRTERPNVGLTDDNIYTAWESGTGTITGGFNSKYELGSWAHGWMSQHRTDSYLGN